MNTGVAMTDNIRGFTVSHINIRSLVNKIDEVSILAHEHKLDVLTISETWLHKSIDNSCIQMNEYSIFRQDREGPLIRKTKGGGLLTYVSKKYQVDSNLHGYLNCCNEDLEAQVLELRRDKYKRAIIVNLYRPPSGNHNSFLEQITTLIGALNSLRYHDLFFIGDLNLDHTPARINDPTKELKTLLEANGLNQVINGTTRKTKNSATILDVIYVKTAKNTQPTIVTTSVSDHYLVMCTTYFGYKSPPKTVITGRSYRNYTRELATEYYSRQRKDLIYQYNDVNAIWSTLHKFIENCANTLCPIRNMMVRSEKPTWIT